MLFVFVYLCICLLLYLSTLCLTSSSSILKYTFPLFKYKFFKTKCSIGWRIPIFSCIYEIYVVYKGGLLNTVMDWSDKFELNQLNFKLRIYIYVAQSCLLYISRHISITCLHGMSPYKTENEINTLNLLGTMSVP